MSKDFEKVLSGFPWQEDVGRPFLLALMCLASRAKVVVELGTFAGHGTEAMLEALKEADGKLYTIDVARYSDGFGGKLEQVLSKYEDRVVFIQDESVKVGLGWDKNIVIDLLYIDTDHQFLQTFKELVIWSQFVRVGGWIVMHDTKMVDVRKAIDMFLSKVNDSYFFYDHRHDPCGIGFLRKLK